MQRVYVRAQYGISSDTALFSDFDFLVLIMRHRTHHTCIARVQLEE